MKMGQKPSSAVTRVPALTVATLMVTPSMAGRPVHTTYALEQMAREADVVAVVSQFAALR